MQTINQTDQTDIQLFVDSFKKKSKLLYRWHKNGIYKIAQQVSPAYRDFVNKLLSNNKLIIERYTGGECVPIEFGKANSLSRRCKNRIRIYFNDCHTFAHELGHSVDFLFGASNSLSSTVIIYGDRTLFDIFKQEFDIHHEELHEFLMNEYRTSIDSNIYMGAYDVFINNMPKYMSLCKTEDRAKRKRLQRELYECGFVEVYYQIQTRKCFKILEQKYAPIIDALSSKYDIRGLYLIGHTLDYYNNREEAAVEEFFANVFADKIMGNHTRYDQLIKLMPNSFDAFERLFFMIYERIQNNKKFTDLPIKIIEECDVEDIEVDENEEDC